MTLLNHVSTAQYSNAPVTCTSCHTPAGVDVAQATTCSTCHPSDRPGVSERLAEEIHNVSAITRVSFNWSNDSTAPLTINFDASASTPACGSYIWDFGDGESDTVSTATTSHQYASTTPATAILSCNSVTVARTVLPKKVAASGDTLLTVNTPTITSVSGYEVTLQDNTSGGTGTKTVKILWGDGRSSVITAGTSTNHVYPKAKRYTIKLIAKDTGADGYKPQTATGTTTWTVGQITVSGVITTVTGTTTGPLSGVKLTLKVGTKTLKSATTDVNGRYTFRDVVPINSLKLMRAYTTATQYVVTPYKRYTVSSVAHLYSFDPDTRTISEVASKASITDLNFDGEK
jgi:hypothetical protein